MRIQVELPANRWNKGVLTVIGDDGESVFTCPARGKADGGRAKRADNPERYPVLPYGDTPLGDYAPTRLIRFAEPHRRLGWGWIPLEGAAGDARTARVAGKRTGLGIHAGRGERLMATYGCLRLRQSDFDSLATLFRGATIEVSIMAMGAAEED